MHLLFYPKTLHIYPPGWGNFYPLRTEEFYLQFPSFPFSQGYTAVGADYPMPGKIAFFGKGMEHSHGIAGAIGKPRFKGNVPIAGNFALGNGEDLFNNPAGGIGHCRVPSLAALAKMSLR